MVGRLTRRTLFPATELIWRWGLRAARLYLGADRTGPSANRPTLKRIIPTADQVVVIVAPHPDDETGGAGGAAALHALAGATVRIVVVTDGGASRAGGLGRDEMVARRAEEVRCATSALGLASEPVLLGFPERQTDTASLRKKLTGLLSDADVIYAPSCVDFHPDHLEVARAVAESVRDGQVVRMCELGVPLTPLLANRFVDIRTVVEQKTAALACFATQAGNLEPLARLERYRTALYGLGPIEVFWELTPSVYHEVIRQGAWSWDDSPFRGIRPAPFSDPLAFLIGRRARMRLREKAQASGS